MIIRRGQNQSLWDYTMVWVLASPWQVVYSFLKPRVRNTGGVLTMSTIMPKSELARKAVKWICEQMEQSEKPLPQLIEEAAMRYNLGPVDVEFLLRFFKDKKD
jgi:hypothetical protein